MFHADAFKCWEYFQQHKRSYHAFIGYFLIFRFLCLYCISFGCVPFFHSGRRTGTVDCAGMCDCTPYTAFRVTKQARNVGSNDDITFHSFLMLLLPHGKMMLTLSRSPHATKSDRHSGLQMGRNHSSIWAITIIGRLVSIFIFIPVCSPPTSALRCWLNYTIMMFY